MPRGYRGGTRAILEILQEQGPQSVPSLVRLTGQDSVTVRRSIRQLTRDGIVTTGIERPSSLAVVVDYVPCNDHRMRAGDRFPSHPSLERRCKLCDEGSERYGVLPPELKPGTERLKEREQEARATGTFGVHVVSQTRSLGVRQRRHAPRERLISLVPEQAAA